MRVSIPASVASDLGVFRKSIASIAERLGCRGCFSGADCFFQRERAFVINEKLEITPAGVFGPLPDPWQVAGPFPQPGRAAGFDLSMIALNSQPLPPSVTVTLAPEIGYDLGKLQESIAKIAGRLGCPSYCSSFDISFRQELDFVVDADLNVQTRS